MKLRVFTAFSGYDSQCMALQRLAERHDDFEFELVGWSEIEQNAIAAHNAVFPQWSDRNYGDICAIDWSKVPDFDLFTYSSPCQDFSLAGVQRGGKKDPEHEAHCCGSAAVQSSPSVRASYCWRMSRISSARSSSRHSASGSKSWHRMATTIATKYSIRRTTACRRIASESFSSRSWIIRSSTFRSRFRWRSVSKMCWKTKWTNATISPTRLSPDCWNTTRSANSAALASCSLRRIFPSMGGVRQLHCDKARL